MLFRTSVTLALAGIALIGSAPALAAGIGHSFFMRGSIVDSDTTGKVVCIGKADGARVGQTLDVYRVEISPGPNRGAGPNYRREYVGKVTIDHVFNDHFAHVTATEGKLALHDIVELRRK